MKKSIILISIMIAVMISLIGINAAVSNKELKDFENDIVLTTNNDNNNISQKFMTQIKDILIGGNYHIALCEDKTVWSWGENSSGKLGVLEESVLKSEPKKISGLNNVTKIMDGGSAIYALLEDGTVFAWGKNSRKLISQFESEDTFFREPIQLVGLTRIIELDVCNDKAFALDESGNLYVWGLYFYGYNGYEDSILNSTPGFPQEYQYLTKDVISVIAGSGEYHYFIRKNGSAFSVMESIFEGFREPYAFIFPSKEEKVNTFANVEEFDIITINENTKMGRTVYYDLTGLANIEKITSDAYTMFICKTDGSLWYWNSDRIKYHDQRSALYHQNDVSERCGGKFVEVNVEDMISRQEQDAVAVPISNMKSGKENVLFLADNGQLFISYYETYATEDVEFYNPNNTNPARTVFTNTINDMELKQLQFKKISSKDIVSINTDGFYGFTATDSEGNYYYWDLSLGIDKIK